MVFLRKPSVRSDFSVVNSFFSLRIKSHHFYDSLTIAGRLLTAARRDPDGRARKYGHQKGRGAPMLRQMPFSLIAGTTILIALSQPISAAPSAGQVGDRSTERIVASRKAADYSAWFIEDDSSPWTEVERKRVALVLANILAALGSLGGWPGTSGRLPLPPTDAEDRRRDDLARMDDRPGFLHAGPGPHLTHRSDRGRLCAVGLGRVRRRGNPPFPRHPAERRSGGDPGGIPGYAGWGFYTARAK